MTTQAPLDSLKELAARADQTAPQILSALAAMFEPGPGQGETSPGIAAAVVPVIGAALELYGRIGEALMWHEPDPVKAGEYSDGRSVTSTIMLGFSGSPFTYVWPADPGAVPDEPQVRAADGRLFQIRVRDGQVTATPCGRGGAMLGEGP
jgi:hypothetical protein